MENKGGMQKNLQSLLKNAGCCVILALFSMMRTGNGPTAQLWGFYV